MAVCVAAGLALPMAGQAVRNRTTTVTMSAPAHVARLPYTAEYKITRTQTLANGATITHESTEVTAIDSHGRRMTATTTLPSAEGETPRTRVFVFDPVDQTNSSWSVPGKKATVTHMPEPGAARTPCASSGVIGSVFTSEAAPVQRARPTVEDLGTETIQGVEARGRRTINTTPAGAIGNNEPLQRISEMWTAVDRGLFGLVVRQMNDDPQSGKMTKELVNFNQSEPDASVFQPPSDYEIVNRDLPAPSCPGTGETETQPAPPAQ
jgi:hypothetical protein